MHFLSRTNKTAWVLTLVLTVLTLHAKETAVTLTTQDGWKIAAAYQPPQADQRTVILLHDLNKNKESFAALEQLLSKNGLGYLALDLRGHGQSTNLGEVRSFAKERVDNPFNKMTRDVDSAIAFLKEKKIYPEQIILLGVGLGANVAAKSTTLWPDLFALALISPAVNIRDVLAIPPMRLYKGNILIAAAAADKKMFLEASIIRNVAYLTAGNESEKITFLTAYDLKSHEMLDKYFLSSVLQWMRTPNRPAILPDAPTVTAPSESNPTDSSGLPVTPSKTEEALVPSILGE